MRGITWDRAVREALLTPDCFVGSPGEVCGVGASGKGNDHGREWANCFRSSNSFSAAETPIAPLGGCGSECVHLHRKYTPGIACLCVVPAWRQLSFKI